MLKHLGTNIIKTEHLLLRPFRSEDCRYMYKNWASDPEVAKFLTWQAHRSIADTENIVNLWVSEYNSMDSYNWVIVNRLTNEPIGSIGVVRINASSEYAEIGYCLGQKWWGRGFMTEALAAVTDYLLNTVGFHSLRACHAVKNPASGRVMEKCGYKFEGTFREYFKAHDGVFLDINFYSRLKSEMAIENSAEVC